MQGDEVQILAVASIIRMLNEADMIEGYLAWSTQNLLTSGLGVETILRRQSLDIGSRRLVARNAFRNTINAFEGFRLRVLDYERWQLNSFVTLPVNRYPLGANDILNDVDALDVADGKTLFSGHFGIASCHAKHQCRNLFLSP
jgi:hypothetical protein